MTGPVRTRQQQRRYEYQNRWLRDTAHAQALKMETTAEFPGVDIDRIHAVWKRRHADAANERWRQETRTPA